MPLTLQLVPLFDPGGWNISDWNVQTTKKVILTPDPGWLCHLCVIKVLVYALIDITVSYKSKFVNHFCLADKISLVWSFSAIKQDQIWTAQSTAWNIRMTTLFQPVWNIFQVLSCIWLHLAFWRRQGLTFHHRYP